MIKYLIKSVDLSVVVQTSVCVCEWIRERQQESESEREREWERENDRGIVVYDTRNMKTLLWGGTTIDRSDEGKEHEKSDV